MNETERPTLPRDIRQRVWETGKLEGEQVRYLMRVYRVKIRELSQRLGITQKRIRQVRECGLDHPYAIRDWIEGIISEDPGPMAALNR